MALAPAPVEVKPLAPLANALQTKQKAAAHKAAQDFEAVFVSQMMEPMFEGIKTDGMFGGGNGESVFRSLLLQEVGKEVAKGSGVGIGQSVYREMLKMQGLKE